DPVKPPGADRTALTRIDLRTRKAIGGTQHLSGSSTGRDNDWNVRRDSADCLRCHTGHMTTAVALDHDARVSLTCSQLDQRTVVIEPRCHEDNTTAPRGCAQTNRQRAVYMGHDTDALLNDEPDGAGGTRSKRRRLARVRLGHEACCMNVIIEHNKL